MIVRPSQGSHERHGGVGVDAEEAHVDRGGSGFGGFGGKGKMLIRKKKWSGSVEQKAEWRAAWKCVRWSRDANIASL